MQALSENREAGDGEVALGDCLCGVFAFARLVFCQQGGRSMKEVTKAELIKSIDDLELPDDTLLAGIRDVRKLDIIAVGRSIEDHSRQIASINLEVPRD